MAIVPVMWIVQICWRIAIDAMLSSKIQQIDYHGRQNAAPTGEMAFVGAAFCRPLVANNAPLS